MKLPVGSTLRAQGQPLLVTGNTGFKGTWLGILLNMLEIPFVGIALPPSENSLFNHLGKQLAETQYFADIRDSQAIDKLVNSINPASVIHMAAQPLVLESYRDPIGTFSTNVMGTAHLLDSLTKSDSMKAALIVTSDKVYRNDNSGSKFAESAPLGGADPYSASKAGTELIIDSWRAISKIRNNLPIAAARSGNVIGGGDFSQDRLLPDLMKSFLSKDETTLRNPESTRPWQHVLDPLIGYLAYLEYLLNGNYERALNFSPDGPSLSVKDVFEISSVSWGREPIFKKVESDNRGSESQLLELDSNRAKEILGWSNLWSQEEAVISTVEWWKNCNMRNMSYLEACQLDLEKAILSKYFE
jgi:CDP-glucose 4,6-dehydratase